MHRCKKGSSCVWLALVVEDFACGHGRQIPQLGASIFVRPPTGFHDYAVLRWGKSDSLKRCAKYVAMRWKRGSDTRVSWCIRTKRRNAWLWLYRLRWRLLPPRILSFSVTHPEKGLAMNTPHAWGMFWKRRYSQPQGSIVERCECVIVESRIIV